MKELLKKIRQSIKDGYLPENWHDSKHDLIELASGYISLNEDITEIDGEFYHVELDSDLICWDEKNDEYILANDAVCCYGKNGREYYTHENNCVRVGRTWYDIDYLGDNDIVQLEDTGDYCHVDDAYYHEYNGYYSYPEEEEEEESDLLWGYGQGEREKDYRFTDHQDGKPVFGFGVEIEKSELPSFEFDKWDIYNTTGAVLERDASVDEGFELKTPIYNLLSTKTDERIETLKGFCNVKGVENAGGHIGFSMQGKTDQELIDLCAGFIPLIFAMYKKRLENQYCSGKKIDDLKSSGEKMQAIRMRGDYIEFRIFSSVKTFDTLKFRLQLFRIMAQNLGKSFAAVMGMAVNKNSELNKLLVNDVYKNPDKFERLIKDAIEINKQFGVKALTQAKINQITNKLNLLKCA